MKPIAVGILVAALAAGLMAGCATTSQTTPAASLASQTDQASLGLKAEEDPAYSLGNPFRIIGGVLYPVGLLLQRVTEVPYAVATRIDPSLWGINEAEQRYLYERWGVRPGPNPDAPAAAPATK